MQVLTSPFSCLCSDVSNTFCQSQFKCLQIYKQRMQALYIKVGEKLVDTRPIPVPYLQFAPCSFCTFTYDKHVTTRGCGALLLKLIRSRIEAG